MRTPDDTQLRESDQFVEQLRTAIQSGFLNVDNARELLRVVLRQQMWKHRIVLMTEQPRDYVDFLRFVTDAPYDGLGTTIATLETLAHGDRELEDLLDQAAQRPRGNTTGNNQYTEDGGNIDIINISSGIPDGTSRAQALRKLRSDAPELHRQVIAGDLSPHAAMVEAGFRRKTVSIPVDDVRAIARALVRHLTVDQIEELTAILSGND